MLLSHLYSRLQANMKDYIKRREEEEEEEEEEGQVNTKAIQYKSSR